MTLLDSTTGSAGTAGATFFGLLFFGVIVALYFLPAFIAYQRHNLNAGGVLVLNLFLGWTFIGWVIALAMAAGGMRREHLGIGPGPVGQALPQYSADGRWWWNGREWVPVQSLPPAQ